MENKKNNRRAVPLSDAGKNVNKVVTAMLILALCMMAAGVYLSMTIKRVSAQNDRMQIENRILERENMSLKFELIKKRSKREINGIK